MTSSLLRNRSFVALWLGQAISSIGDYFSLLAIPIFVNRLTGSVMLVGLSFIVTTLPALVLGPVAGVFVDRLDRRKVMIVSDVLRGLLMLCLLTIQDAQHVWILYLVGFLASCSSQFFSPARMAALPLIVADPRDWLAANSAMRILQTVGMLAGPALAGFSIGLWGERVAFAADGISFLASAAAIYFVSIPHAAPAPGAEGRPDGAETTAAARFTGADVSKVWAELREGMAYLVGNRVTLGVLICLSMASLGFSTVNMIWIPYLQRVFGIGAEGLGIADAALGVGMLVSGALVGRLAARLSRTFLSAGGLLLIGLSYITIIWLPSFPWIIAWQFLAGLVLIPMQSALDTIQQVAVPDLMRGRVSSSMNASFNAAGLISMALASMFGETAGLRNVFLIVGLFVFAAGVLGFWLLRESPAATQLEPGPAI